MLIASRSSVWNWLKFIAEKLTFPMNDAELNFLDIAVQYYVAARSAVIAQLAPVCGNFYHHSIEAFLKAKLSQNLSLKEVKKKGGKFGHELPQLWDAFKAEFLSENLSRFDNTIAAIQRFEKLLLARGEI